MRWAHLRVRPIVAVVFRCRGTPACVPKSVVMDECGRTHRIMGGHIGPPLRVFVAVVLGIVRGQRRAGDHDAAFSPLGLRLGGLGDVPFLRDHDARLIRLLLFQMRDHVGMVHRHAADEPREEAVGAEPRS